MQWLTFSTVLEKARKSLMEAIDMSASPSTSKSSSCSTLRTMRRIWEPGNHARTSDSTVVEIMCSKRPERSELVMSMAIRESPSGELVTCATRTSQPDKGDSSINTKPLRQNEQWRVVTCISRMNS